MSDAEKEGKKTQNELTLIERLIAVEYEIKALRSHLFDIEDGLYRRRAKQYRVKKKDDDIKEALTERLLDKIRR